MFPAYWTGGGHGWLRCSELSSEFQIVFTLGRALRGAGRVPRRSLTSGTFRTDPEFRGSETRGRGRRGSAQEAFRSFAYQRFDIGETVRLACYETWLKLCPTVAAANTAVPLRAAITLRQNNPAGPRQEHRESFLPHSVNQFREIFRPDKPAKFSAGRCPLAQAADLPLPRLGTLSTSATNLRW